MPGTALGARLKAENKKEIPIFRDFTFSKGETVIEMSGSISSSQAVAGATKEAKEGVGSGMLRLERVVGRPL